MSHTSNLSPRLSAWRLIIVGLLALVLVACGRPLPTSSSPTPTPVATEQIEPTAASSTVTSPTASPEPTSTPLPTATPEPTIPPTPTPAPLLPAPLYFLSNAGQVVRLEVDGQTQSLATDAPAPVTDFDVARITGAIAYVSDNDLYLIAAPGQEPRLLLAGPDQPTSYLGTPRIAFLRFSPQGGRLAYGLEGVQIIDVASDQVRVIQADDPPDAPGAGTYYPIAWAPDGARLLIGRSFYTTSGSLEIHNIDSEGVVQMGSACCHPAWTPDNQYVYVSGPYFGPRVETGLRRYNTQDGGRETLIAPDAASMKLTLVDFAQMLGDGKLYSFQTQTTKPDYSQRNGVMDFDMVRTAPDGHSERETLRSDAHPVLEALWADDGSGAVLVLRPVGDTLALNVLWLPVGDGPAFALGARVPITPTHRLSWGPTEAALTRANLKAQFLSDAGIELAPEGVFDGFTDVAVVPLMTKDEALWAVHTVGMRSYDAAAQPHLVALYARAGDGWRQVALQSLGGDGDSADPGADYIGEDGVKQVMVEPTGLWLEINGGAGAHSGTYHLVRFDGSQFRIAATGFSPNPGNGRVEDLNDDGLGEVVLDASDPYVFCYACGVRYADARVLRWDGQHMAPVELAMLGDSAPASLRTLNNRAVTLAQAGLWKQALDLIPALLAQNSTTSVPGDDAAMWNIALIRLIGEDRRQAVQDSPYPILPNLFFGDYEAAIKPFRQHKPREIFAQPSVLVTGTVAEGWEEAVDAWVFDVTKDILDSDPASASASADHSTQAAAHFLRGWAAYLLEPTSPTVIEEVARALQLQPDDPLFTRSYAFLKGRQ